MRRLRKVKEEENEREGGALGIRDPASPDKTALGAGATKAPEGARGVFFLGGETTEGEPLLNALCGPHRQSFKNLSASMLHWILRARVCVCVCCMGAPQGPMAHGALP